MLRIRFTAGSSIRRKPPTRRNAVTSVILMIVFTGVFGAFGAYQAALYLTGDVTTAHVTRCETREVSDEDGSHHETTCWGTWRAAGGTVRSGRIQGLDSARDQGTDQHVRVSGDTALSDSPAQLWPLLPAVLCLLMLALSIFQVRVAFAPTRGGMAGGVGPPGYRPPSGGYPTPRR